MAAHFLREMHSPNNLVQKYLRDGKFSHEELTQALKQIVSSKGFATAESVEIVKKLLQAICLYQASPERWELNDVLGHELIDPERLINPTDYDTSMCVYDLERLRTFDEPLRRSEMEIYLTGTKDIAQLITRRLKYRF